MSKSDFFRNTAVMSMAMLLSEGAMAALYAPLPAAPMPGPGIVVLIAAGIVGAIAISRSGK